MSIKENNIHFEDSETDILDVAITLARSKYTIILVIVCITAVGLIVSLLWPKTYKADLTFIMSKDQSINLSGGGLLSSIANISVDNSRISSDQVILIARSKAIVDQIIDDFQLQDVYEIEIQEALRKNFLSSLEIVDIREGGFGFNSIYAIQFSFIDKDPQRAFDLLMHHYTLVDSTVKLFNRQSIEVGLQMLENRIKKNEYELKNAEDSLISFQSKFGILEINEQTKALIQNIASVKAEALNIELELSYAKAVLSENTQLVSDLELKKQQLEKQYDRLLSGTNKTNESDLFKSASEIPNFYIEYIRRFRELEIQQELYKILFPQYQQQLLNFNEVNSGLILIDPPTVPTYKESPKRAYIVIAFFMFGFFFSILFVLVREWVISSANRPDNGTTKKIQVLFTELKP